MKRDKPILRILADHTGVYEIGIRAPANDYGNAEHLSSTIKPAIAIIDRAIRYAYLPSPQHSASRNRDGPKQRNR